MNYRKEVALLSSIGNKEIFARNLMYYIDRSGKSQKELADMLDVATSTFNNWVKAKKYPRIDKIEMLANYFGIQKSDLIEEKLTKEKEKDNDMLADIIVRMRTDEGFRSLVERLYVLDSNKIEGVSRMLQAFD
jgi:transcriptional regulator with XRE-family HTH domain